MRNRNLKFIPYHNKHHSTQHKDFIQQKRYKKSNLPATIKQIRNTILFPGFLDFLLKSIHPASTSTSTSVVPPHLISATTYTSNLGGYKKNKARLTEKSRKQKNCDGSQNKNQCSPHPHKIYYTDFNIFSHPNQLLHHYISFHFNLDPDRQSRCINKVRINI